MRKSNKKNFITGIILLLFAQIILPIQLDAKVINLSPAKWIWYPSERTLQNTFILFRKEINIVKEITSAKGWLIADSRYQLFVNGQRVQWGPAPSDPRWQEADPIDLTRYLLKGNNVIACQVLFYGAGDGTSPIGVPGFLFNLNIDGQQVLSDSSWKSFLARSWNPGQYKRWFLRSLQEQFDARLFPYGWNDVNFEDTKEWLDAMELKGSADKPSISDGYPEYLGGISGNENTELRERSIPLMKESDVKIKCLTEAFWLDWKISPDNYFDMKVPHAFMAEAISPAPNFGNKSVTISPNAGKTVALTFEFNEQSVGFPYFTIDAPGGTIVEMIVHEANKPGNEVIINSHFNSWSRFICKEGLNTFSTFDFESLRWIQLHVRNFNKAVTISNIGIRRRVFDFKITPKIKISDPVIQKLMDANINTFYNAAQDIVVDGMARERQQYSGDGGHQLHPLFQVFNEKQLAARFINTFGQGITKEGYFMDCWPGYDRLARIPQREMDLTPWGPLVDHGVGFCFDVYNFYLYTGDKDAVKETYPRLIRFFKYLNTIMDRKDSLLKVDDIGVPVVWLDHQAFKQQRHKQLPFNLYVSAMCQNALAPLCEAYGDKALANEVRLFSSSILRNCVLKFWSKSQNIFVDNLPWISEDKGVRYSDRSLATALLYHQCPNNDEKRSLQILKESPNELGISYACNAVWRYWALAENNEMQSVLDELRQKWGNMASVKENNTISEDWHATYNSEAQWSHAAVAPLVMLYQGLAGAKPLSANSRIYRLYPKPCDLKLIDFDIQTTCGAIGFKSEGLKGRRTISICVPINGEVELWLDSRERVNLPVIEKSGTGIAKYKVAGGSILKLLLKYT